MVLGANDILQLVLFGDQASAKVSGSCMGRSEGAIVRNELESSFRKGAGETN